MVSSPEAPPSEFDLTALVSVQDHILHWGRVFQKGLACLVTGAGVVGFLLFFSRPSSFAPSAFPGLLGASIALTFAAGLAWWVAGRPSSTARRLSISDRALTFGSIPSGKTLTLRWDDPKFRLTVYDRRGLPKLHRDGTLRNLFAVVPRGGDLTPIPEAACAAILQEVGRHRLAVRRHDISTGDGTVKAIEIRGPAV